MRTMLTIRTRPESTIYVRDGDALSDGATKVDLHGAITPSILDVFRDEETGRLPHELTLLDGDTIVGRVDIL